MNADAETFSTPIRVTINSESSLNPAIANDGTNVYAVWNEVIPETNSNHRQIFFSKSVDDGITWSIPQKLSNNNSGNARSPDIAIDGSNIFVTWYDPSSGINEIYFSRSTDGGATWNTPQNISNARGQLPSIDNDGSNIFVTWDSGGGPNTGSLEVLFSRSTNGGMTWSSPVVISENGVFSFVSDIATNGSDIFVSWEVSGIGNRDIHVSKSSDGGITWSTPQNISNNPGASTFSSIATHGTNVFVTWSDINEPDHEILFSKSIDGGATWSSPPQNISNTAENSHVPAITSDGTNLFLVWEEGLPGFRDIYFSKSTDNGSTWSAPQNISDTQQDAVIPDISTDGVNIFATWYANVHIFVSKAINDTPPPGDIASPTIGSVSDITIDAAGPNGAIVNYDLPEVTDDTDPNPTISCNPSSGSLFPIGTTTVTCTAEDESGNTASANFDVQVSQKDMPNTFERGVKVLDDSFEGAFDWSAIQNGVVTKTNVGTDAVSGDNVARKTTNNDPHGALKQLDTTVNDFELMVYSKRVSVESGGSANRYSIVQSTEGNGYGFYVSGSLFVIEKRDNFVGIPLVTTSDSWDLGQWNTFRFIKIGSDLTLEYYKNQIVDPAVIEQTLPTNSLTTSDNRYSGGFNYAAINGGQDFDTDDFRVWPIGDLPTPTLTLQSLQQQINDIISMLFTPTGVGSETDFQSGGTTSCGPGEVMTGMNVITTGTPVPNQPTVFYYKFQAICAEYGQLP